MSDILFVSESEIQSPLEMAFGEINHYGYSLTPAVNINQAIDFLKGTSCNVVLINAYNKKIEAYELCKEIKEIFRGGIKTYVYIPNSSANEGSKFGLANAEVEDSESITNIVDKLPSKNMRDYLLEENVISIYGMHGGTGTSMMAILLAYMLDKQNHTSLVLESSTNKAIKNYLNINSRLSLLVRDHASEMDQAKDLDWFSGFISHTPSIPGLNYLNLFNDIEEKYQHLENPSKALNSLAREIDSFQNKLKVEQKPKEEISAFMFSVNNSLKLISKDLQGESYTLFDEVVQLGSKLAQNFIFDLSSDVYSSLNKQLLGLSNKMIIVFRDTANIKDEYLAQKKFFEEKYKLRVIPVIAPPHYYYSKYEGLSKKDWESIIGEVPLIYPYDPETIIRFIYDHEEIEEKRKVYKFAKELLRRCSIEVEESKPKDKGLLNFLVSNSK